MTDEGQGAAGRSSGSVGVIEMKGRVDRSSETAMNAAYDDATANGVSELDLRFGEVEYINSTGIAVIVGILARARKDGLRVTAHGLSDHYKHVFEITRLSDFMSIENGEASEGGES